MVRGKNWTEDELEYLGSKLGTIPKKEIARRLGRSENALKIAAFRKLNGLAQRDNIYTATAVARALGVSSSKTITTWMERGYIKGKPAPFSCGNSRCWRFEYDDIISCLRERPWLVDHSKMDPGYFRNIVRKEYEKDPWYGCKEAGLFLGVVDINAVHRYIHRGWLPYFKRPHCGKGTNGSWGYVVRRSGIDQMLANDPRPARRRLALIKSRHASRLREGYPVPVSKEWLMRCPVCRHRIRIISEPKFTGPELHARVLAIIGRGPCTHGKKLFIPLKPRKKESTCSPSKRLLS